MKTPRTNAAAFTIVELLVVLAILAVLVWMAIPKVEIGLATSPMTGALSHARQLQMVTQQMSLDNFNAGTGIQWTTQRAGGKDVTVSLAEYFSALTNNGPYLTEKELRKLLTMDGKGPGPLETPDAENIAFRFFAVSEKSPEDQPFIITANWKNGALTGGKPFGKKGFVVFTKGGGGGIYRLQQLASTNIFPTSPKYHYETLK
jgi:prepilin-type N-terminal cleavage/methylation domain-containing protein